MYQVLPPYNNVMYSSFFSLKSDMFSVWQSTQSQVSSLELVRISARIRTKVRVRIMVKHRMRTSVRLALKTRWPGDELTWGWVDCKPVFIPLFKNKNIAKNNITECLKKSNSAMRTHGIVSSVMLTMWQWHIICKHYYPLAANLSDIKHYHHRAIITLCCRKRWEDQKKERKINIAFTEAAKCLCCISKVDTNIMLFRTDPA